MQKITPLRTALAGFGLGVLGDWCLRGQPPGGGVFVWGLMLAAVVGWWTGCFTRQGLARPGTWLLLAGVACLSLWLWRDTEPLLVWGTLGFGAALVLQGIEALERPLPQLRLLEGLVAAVEVAVRVLFCPLLLVARWAGLGEAGDGDSRVRRLAGWVLGLVLAAGVLVLFGALLRSGDPLFEKFTDPFLQWDWRTAVSHLVVMLFLGWLVTGHLESLRHGPAWLAGREEQWLPHLPRPGVVSVALPLLMLNLVLLLYALVQARFWFGGMETVLATAGLTLAEYARRGFFELVITAGLGLGTLWLADGVWDRREPRHLRLYRGLAVPLLLLVTVVMASAVVRLGLYISRYGLTESRIYAAAVLVWVAAVLVWFALTVLRDQGRRFLFGAIAGAYGTFLALAAMNPHGLVARVNLARAAQGRPLDVKHLTTLSADAVPPIVAVWDRLSRAEREQLSNHLRKRGQPPPGDWRTWNLARQRAYRALAARSVKEP